MNWFMWRQHRNQLVIFGAIMAVFTVLVVLTGNHYWHSYQHALTVCQQNPATPSCSAIQDSLGPNFGAVLRVVYVTALAVPLVLGLFLGSPLFSKEYEEGTNKLVWTQSVSRRKWLTSKLVWTIIFAALYGLAISLLVSWWARTTNSLEHSRFDTGQFDVQGIMPLAYSVFFTAVGFTMSAWFRKTIVALAVTLALFIAFQASVGQWIRPHYMPQVTLTVPIGSDTQSMIPQGAWILREDLVDKTGRTFDGFTVGSMPADCQALLQKAKSGNGDSSRAEVSPEGAKTLDACLNNAGYHQIAKYQPADRYWDFQRIEAGIYLAMTLLAIGGTYWLVLKRDA